MQPIYYQQQPQQELVFYQDASPVVITSSKAILLDKTFPLRNIVSVSMAKNDTNIILEFLLFLAGLVLFWFGITTDLSQTVKVAAFWVSGVIAIIAGCALMLRKATKPGYVLVVGNAGGQFKTVYSKDSAYIANLVNVLNTALTYAH